MISNKILPAHILRLYTWELLKANSDIALINGKVPFVPLSEEPELADSGKTYLVYGYSEQNAGGRMKEIKRGAFSMRIIAQSFSELGNLTGVIQRAFENGDRSAANVNLWSSKFSGADLIGIRFTDLEVTYIEGGTPSDMETGPVEGMINIGYEYVSRQSVKLFDGTTWS